MLISQTVLPPFLDVPTLSGSNALLSVLAQSRPTLLPPEKQLLHSTCFWDRQSDS